MELIGKAKLETLGKIRKTICSITVDDETRSIRYFEELEIYVYEISVRGLTCEQNCHQFTTAKEAIARFSGYALGTIEGLETQYDLR